MNGKVANIIALELAILIAVLAWLAFPRLTGVRQPTASERSGLSEAQERADNSFATVTRAVGGRNQPRNHVDYRANDPSGQPGDEESAAPVQQYDQQLATAPYAAPGYGDNVIIENAPSYAGVNEEPAYYPPDQFDYPYDQFVGYAQPNAIVIISNVRAFGPRLRGPGCFSRTQMFVPHRRPALGQPRVRGGGIPARTVPASHNAPASGLVSPRNATPPSFRPGQGARRTTIVRQH